MTTVSPSAKYPVVPESERTLGEFLGRRYGSTGARLQLIGILAFGGVILASSGLVVFVVCLGVGLGGGFAFGYWRFRRTGRI